MEIHAYNEAYLDNAMVTMATMLDYAVNEKHEHIDSPFITREIVHSRRRERAA